MNSIKSRETFKSQARPAMASKRALQRVALLATTLKPCCKEMRSPASSTSAKGIARMEQRSRQLYRRLHLTPIASKKTLLVAPARAVSRRSIMCQLDRMVSSSSRTTVRLGQLEGASLLPITRHSNRNKKTSCNLRECRSSRTRLS